MQSWNRWYIWNGSKWQEDRVVTVFGEIRSFLTLEQVLAEDMDPGEIRKLGSANTVAGVERLAKSNPSVAALPELWDADAWLLNTPGGIVDLRTGNVEPHRPDAHMAKITNASIGGTAPVWLEFLNVVTGGDVELQ